MGVDSTTRTVELEQIGFSRLLFSLLKNRFTGTLKLHQSSPPGARTVWFVGGMPVHTDWIDVSESLGQVLMDMGAIAGHQLLEALRDGNASRIGQVLLHKGMIDEGQLTLALQRQAGRKLVHVFESRTGTIKITAENHDHGRREDRGQVNVLELISRGVHAHYDAARVLDETRLTPDQRVAASDSFHRYQLQFRFNAEDTTILSALTTATTLGDLVRTPGMDATRVYQVAYVLWACEMLQVDTMTGARQASTPASQPTARPVAPPAAQPAAPQPALPADPSPSRAQQSATHPGPQPRAEPELAARPKLGTVQPAEQFSHVPAFAEAEQLMHAGRFEPALALYQQVAMEEETPYIRASIMWCDYHCTGKSPEQAQRCIDGLELILRDHPEIARAHYYKGLLLMRLGTQHLAMGAFQAALDADPGMTDADRQIRLIRGRKNRPKAGRNPLRSMFGKK